MDIFRHGRAKPKAPSPHGRGRGVRGLAALGKKPLTLTLSRRERGQSSMAKKVV